MLFFVVGPKRERNISKWVDPRRDLYFGWFIHLFRSYIRVCFREHIWHKALLMGYSMRLELTRVCILYDFQLVMDLYGGYSFFLECVHVSLLYPHWYLIFDKCVCVCVLEWFLISITVIFSLCVLRFCVRVSVVEWFEIYL